MVWGSLALQPDLWLAAVLCLLPVIEIWLPVCVTYPGVLVFFSGLSCAQIQSDSLASLSGLLINGGTRDGITFGAFHG